MKPLSPRSRLKGDPFLPNRFIFGDAIEAGGIEQYEYLIHTEQPAFICRIMRREIAFAGAENDTFASAMLFDPEENVTYYASNDGLALTDFVFYCPPDEEPTVGKLQKICDKAMVAYWALDAAYQQVQAEGSPYGRQIRTVIRAPHTETELTEAIVTLADAAQRASQSARHMPQLIAGTHAALNTGEPRIFTHAQFSLSHTPAARSLLVNTARELIAQPDVARSDGAFIPYELWAMPLLYSTHHAGDCWFFPKLTALEPVLSAGLGVAYGKMLHVSPTLFSPEMLHESGCQALVHLAGMLDGGEAFAPSDVEAMLATYQAQREQFLPRLQIGWVVFAVERGAIDVAALEDANPLLDTLMPLVDEALSDAIDYEEASVFAPTHLWEALETGIEAINQQRLTVIADMLEKNLGLEHIRARVEYLPAEGAYQLSLHHTEEDNALVTRFPWLVTPDITPNPEEALVHLKMHLTLLGIVCEEVVDRRH